MASFEWIVGWFVIDIPQTMQVLQTFVIGCFRTDFTYSHYLISIYAYWIFKAIAIPKLEQSNV